MSKYRFFIAIAILCASQLHAQQTDTITIIGNDIDEVQVTARVEQPTDNHTVLNQQQLNQHNTGQNLPYLLTLTPSLIVMSDDGLGVGYTYFRIRGTDQSRINMTINDVPLNDQESQTVFWVNMTDMSSSMSSLNVQRGVGTSTNGSAAFGASVNMTTAPTLSDTVSHYELGFNGGMYNTFREYAKADIILPHHFRAEARFSKVNSDGYLERAKSDLYSYHGSIGYFGRKTKVNLSVFGGKEKTYMAWDGVEEYQLKENPRYNPAGKYKDNNGNTAYYPNQTDNYAQQHAQLHLTQTLTPQLFLDATLHYTHGGGYYEQYKTDRKLKEYALQEYSYTTNIDGKDTTITVEKSDLIRQKHMNNHFYGGVLSLRYITEPVDAQFGVAANHYIGEHWGKVIYLRDSLYPYNVDYDHEYYRNTGAKIDANAYAKANWRIINHAQEKLVLYADLQYRFVDYRIKGINGSDENLGDIDVHQTYHFFNPKAGLTYQNRQHHAYFNFAIANREPARDNFTYAAYSTQPLPERLYDYELGYTYSHRLFSVGANLYMMDYDNQLVLTGDYSETGEYLTKNVKDSYRMGIELTFGLQPIDWFRWDFNLTLSRNRILNYSDIVSYYDSNYKWVDAQEKDFGNVDIAFSPNVTFGNLFTFSTHGFESSLQTNVVGKQYLDNSMNSTAMLRPYTVTNLNLQYLLPLPERCPKIRLLAQINNLFNTHYVSNGGSDMSCFQGTTTACWPWYYAQAGINCHAGFNIVF